MNDKLKELIVSTTNKEELHLLLNDYHPYDIAKIFNELNDEDQNKLIECFSNEELAEIFSYIDSEQSSEIFEDLPAEKTAAIINEMEADDASDVIQDMNEDSSSEVLELLDEDVKKDIVSLAKYEEDTAGALMNPNYVKILSGTSVKMAMKELTKQAPEVETIDTIFVVNDDDLLLGVVSLKELIVARMPKTVDEIMNDNFIYGETSDSHEEIIKKVSAYDIPSLPILENGIIKGIITMDDAFDALTDAAEEDYAKLAGLTEDEDSKETIVGSVKKRIPWLAVLLVADVFIALVISAFDGVIEKLTALTFFQAAVLGLSGNCGTQALAISVRNISSGLGDKKGAIARQVGRELLQGLGTGLILSAFSFGLVYLLLIINPSLLDVSDTVVIKPYQMGIVLSVSIMIAVTVSNLIGSILPIFFYKIHIDPAVASGPFITTINDVVAVLIYFGTAMLLFYSYLGL